jgi:hypothetical protein
LFEECSLLPFARLEKESPTCEESEVVVGLVGVLQMLPKALTREVQALIALAKAMPGDVFLQRGTFDLSVAPHERLIAVTAHGFQVCWPTRGVDGVLQAGQKAARPHGAYGVQLLGCGEAFVYALAAAALMGRVAK